MASGQQCEVEGARAVRRRRESFGSLAAEQDPRTLRASVPVQHQHPSLQPCLPPARPSASPPTSSSRRRSPPRPAPVRWPPLIASFVVRPSATLDQLRVCLGQTSQSDKLTLSARPSALARPQSPSPLARVRSPRPPLSAPSLLAPRSSAVPVRPPFTFSELYGADAGIPAVGPVRGYAAEAGGKFTRSKPHMNIGCVPAVLPAASIFHRDETDTLDNARSTIGHVECALPSSPSLPADVR